MQPALKTDHESAVVSNDTAGVELCPKASQYISIEQVMAQLALEKDEVIELFDDGALEGRYFRSTGRYKFHPMAVSWHIRHTRFVPQRSLREQGAEAADPSENNLEQPIQREHHFERQNTQSGLDHSISDRKNYTSQSLLTDNFSVISLLANAQRVNQERNKIGIDISGEDALSVDFVNNYSGGIKTISGYKALRICVNKESVRLFIRVKNEKDLKLISIPRSRGATEQDIQAVKSMHRRFLKLQKEGRPWNNIKYLNQDSLVRIESILDLLRFHQDHGNHRPSHIQKMERMISRYFNGEKGKRSLKSYCVEQFAKDFLESPHPQRVKTDRDTVIKMMSAAHNFALSSSQVVSRDFPNLVDGLKRNRTRKGSKVKPELCIFIGILNQGIEMGYHDMVFNLILQEELSTRKNTTTKLKFNQVYYDRSMCEVYAQDSKSGDYKQHLMSSQCVSLLQAYEKALTKERKGQPIFLFESPTKKGQARSHFDDQFNKAKKAYRDKVERDFVGDDFAKSKTLAAIDAFTQHRIRDLTEKTLLDMGATPAQKDIATCHSIGNVDTAYGDLSDQTIIELKTKKHQYLIDNVDGYEEVIEQLRRHFAD